MARTTSFTKRSLISKANSSMVIATTIAAFVLVFTLVAGKSLLSEASYQNRVISKKKVALKQLKDDLAARDTLAQSYNTFVSENPNVIGGDATQSTGNKNGNNAQLVLDALPSTYDFPALTTSLEKLITDQSLNIVAISGTDQEASQSSNQSSPNPQPVPMPFQIQVSGNYQSVQNLFNALESSIRPFQIQTLELSGDENNMTATIQAQTFYQPGKSLKIQQEVVR